MRYKEDEEIEELRHLNNELIQLMKINSKDTVFLTAIGNSISNGFSYAEPGKLLLQRNYSLVMEGMLECLDIQLYHLTRSENNNSMEIYNWIRNNYTEEDAYNWNKVDYLRLANKGEFSLDEKTIKRYFSNGSDEGVQEVLSKKGTNVANIVILNAGTGSFIDNLIKHGKIGIPSINYALKRDVMGIAEILEFILNNNRQNGATTQVYLCGAPRIMNTCLTDVFMNPAIKRLVKEYPNVTYVPSFPRAAYYKNDEGKIILDVHYNNAEYCHLLGKIEEAIIGNYLARELMIEMDRELYNMSVSNDIKNGNYDTSDLLYVVNDYAIKYNGKENFLPNFISGYNHFIDLSRKYIELRYPHDFYMASSNNNLGKDIKKLYRRL